MKVLSDTQIAESLEAMPGWRREGLEIVKEFRFGAYADNLVFASAVGRIADRRDHHPDMLITYPSVRVSLTTHSEGGVTQKDIDLATEAERVFRAIQ